MSKALVLVAVLASGTLRAQSAGSCVRAGDFYAAPTTAVPVVDLGGVKITEAVFPSGGGGGLVVDDCDGDKSLDVFIRWSEKAAAPPATIWFTTVCDGNLPSAVTIESHTGTPTCTWRAYDGSGVLVDTKVTAAAAAAQVATLASPSGIRRVTVEGAQVCISSICWKCDGSTPSRQCADPGDYYPKPASDLAVVDLGDVRVTPAKLPTGAPAPLAIGDCNHDGSLDLIVPWSEGTASPPATIHFRGACTPGVFPVRVAITFTQGVSTVKWNAYNVAHALVDSETTTSPPIGHTVVLESAGGIFQVEIDGAELCISRICWECKEAEEPTSDCATVAKSYPKPADDVLVADLGSIYVSTSRLPSGDPVPMSVRDCNDDGKLDLSIPWSEASGMKLVDVVLKEACGGTTLPTVVAVTLITDNAKIHAFDSANVEVDADAAAPVYGLQTLTVTNAGGIAYVAIEGSQMCLVGVCWRCPERLEPPTFVRGDSNQDRKLDLSDAVHWLSALFLGGPLPKCADAADSNDDGRLDISDASATLNFLFLGTKPLPGGPACSPDLTEDRLDCESSACN
jgi:hypothetical protein